MTLVAAACHFETSVFRSSLLMIHSSDFLWVPMYCNFCKIKCNCTILMSSTQQSLIQKSWSRSQYHLPWYHMKGFFIREWNKTKLIIYIYCPVWRETWLFVQPRKFMSPKGDINFLGWTNLHVSRLTGQLTVDYTESWSTILYGIEHCAVRHDSKTWYLESGRRHEDLSLVHLTSLDQSYFSLFIVSIIWGIINIP